MDPSISAFMGNTGKVLVRKGGLEPPHPCGHKNLNLPFLLRVENPPYGDQGFSDITRSAGGFSSAFPSPQGFNGRTSTAESRPLNARIRS